MNERVPGGIGELDAHARRVLEFDKVVALLAARALTAPGRELAEALRPAATPQEARARLADTGEARRLLDREGEPPFEGVGDLRPVLGRAARGAAAEPAELLGLGRTLAAGRRLRRFLEGRAEAFPRLAVLAGGIGDFPGLLAEIRRCITPEGDVADDASPELAALRRRSRDLQARLRERLEAMVRSQALRPYLQEPLVTLREDRFVLPVRQEHRAQVPGIVHDQSASGATLFIEPVAVVELNNDLRRVSLEMRREEERALLGLSRRVAREGEALAATGAVLARLDLVLACGRLGRDMGATAPELGEDGVIDLPGARHPLLGERAVPVDVRLGRDFVTLVITGPNTGGKTVTLKTLGLLVLMAQSGLHVPAAPGSRVAFFGQVFADIGDEQSIEQSLSTFSSHMRNLVRIAAAAGPGTLVLLDELGAGTDPAEGAALGMALLEHLQAAGARTAATTHLSELKTFAYAREGMQNASVEFDVETLAPTYRLAIGLPGRSNAFEIAARLGLAPEIVRRARAFAGREHERVDALLAAVERERRALAAEREAAARLRAEAERLRGEAERRAERLEREREALRARREEVLASARAQARALVEEARREAAEAVARLRRAEAEAGETGARAALLEAEAARQGLRRAGRRLGGAGALPETLEAGVGDAEAPADGALTPGRAVRVRGTALSGRLLEVSPDGRAAVQAGAMRLVVPAADVIPLSAGSAGAGGGSGGPGAAGATGPAAAGRARGAAGGAGAAGAARSAAAQPPAAQSPPVQPLPARARYQSLTRQKAAEVSTEIHLRRLTVDEALARLDKYLDDAALAGLEQVRIVHGKGTGTLRRAVAEFLRTHRLVADHRPGGEGEGGAGVTVARLKDRI